MPKSIIIDPEVVFRRDSIHFSDIQLNAYQKTAKEEIAAYSPEILLNLWQDMCAIREFESVLNEIKLKGVCKGVFTRTLSWPGTLSIGQEAAAAVGYGFSC